MNIIYSRGCISARSEKVIKRASLGSIIKKVTSKCFATLKANVTVGARKLAPIILQGENMDNIKFYEVSGDYINYLSPHVPHLFHNKTEKQQNERKYIGIVFQINDVNYFAPLSSYKQKHKHMIESIDFIKIKNYAVINLNNMFPVPEGNYSYVDIAKERNPKYKSLLLAEYRYIKSIQEKIRKNARNIYKIKTSGKVSSLTKRCNDFIKLEELCKKFKK